VPSSDAPLEFFVDRNLGRRQVPNALRGAGWVLRTHHEVYGNRDEEVPDVEWLEFCGRERLPVLTKDRNLRYRPAEIDSIRRYGVRVFVLTGGSLRADEQAARFDRSRQRIEEACQETGPFIYAVHVDRIVRIFPQ
jgi:hypothetical protein